MELEFPQNAEGLFYSDEKWGKNQQDVASVQQGEGRCNVFLLTELNYTV